MENLNWTQTAPDVLVSERFAYGIDSKGRAVGGYAAIYYTPKTRTFFASGDIREVSNPLPWSARVYSTRNGAQFGALPRASHYASLADAKSGAAKALAVQQKRRLAEVSKGLLHIATVERS